MTTRSKFIKSEIRKIYKLLNVIYENVGYSGLEDEERFKKIFELLMEISEKSNTLQQVVNGNYFYLNNKIKWRLNSFLR